MFLKIFLVLLLALSIFAKEKCSGQGNQGGLSSVCPKVIAKYMKRIHRISTNYKWNPSVQRLAKLINSDPALRYNW